VEYLRHKFTRACEIERQDKMKQWYDKDAMRREFKPGEKVFVLLFIHCLPLQAKYCWPYVIESGLNDLIYIVNTPTRRKKCGRYMSYLPSWSKTAPTPTSLTSNVNLYSFEKTCVVT
jgi:hypothetical protein